MQRTITPVIITLVIILSAFITRAQQGYSVSLKDNELIGKWKVRTAIKKLSMNSLIMCTNYSEFRVTKDSITYQLDNDSTVSQTVPYTWNIDNEIYTIQFKEGHNDFQLYFARERIILEGLPCGSGCLLLLEKKK